MGKTYTKEKQAEEVHAEVAVEEETLAKKEKREINPLRHQIVLRDVNGDVIGRFQEVLPKEARLINGTFSNRVQLEAVLAKFMPQEDCFVECDGSVAGVYTVYTGNGTEQTAINENTKKWNGIAKEVVSNIYEKEKEKEM